jgi:hypothetical protein
MLPKEYLDANMPAELEVIDHRSGPAGLAEGPALMARRQDLLNPCSPRLLSRRR